MYRVGAIDVTNQRPVYGYVKSMVTALCTYCVGLWRRCKLFGRKESGWVAGGVGDGSPSPVEGPGASGRQPRGQGVANLYRRLYG